MLSNAGTGALFAAPELSQTPLSRPRPTSSDSITRSDNMPRGGRGSHQQPLRRSVDLTGILSVAEKNDLITLINAITEKLHNDICTIFDSPPVTPLLAEHGHNHWLMLPLLHRKESKPSASQQHPRAKLSDGSKAYNQARGIIEKEENEAMTPQLRELKKEAVIFFRKWQGAVLQRARDMHVNEVSIVPENLRGRGRGARGVFRARAGRGVRGGRGALTLARGPPRAPSNHVDLELCRKFPPIPNTLWSLHMEKRKLLLHIATLLVLSLQDYNANSRLLLLNLVSSLNLPIVALHDDEVRLAQGLAQTAIDATPPDASEHASIDVKLARKLKLASLGHAKCANLAAPLAAVGVGSPHDGLGLTTTAAAGLLGPLADNGFIAGTIFGMHGPRPTAKVIESLAREMQDFGFVPVHGEVRAEYLDCLETRATDRRLRLVIAINGWYFDKEDVITPWQCLGKQAEVYAVRWEVAALRNVGSSLETVIKSAAWARAKKEIFARTIFKSLMESVWPVSLLKVSKLIDTPWSVGMVRAEKLGVVLADAIARTKCHGDRPVCLIGYSLAARAIYTCLMVLAERRQFGVVDSVVMMGTPAPSESRVWLTLKSVVSGRLVNVFSKHDYILGFLYRLSNIQFGVAGLQEVQGADGVENHDVGEWISGHKSYRDFAGRILQDIGWEDLDASTLGPNGVSVVPVVKR